MVEALAAFEARYDAPPAPFQPPNAYPDAVAYAERWGEVKAMQDAALAAARLAAAFSGLGDRGEAMEQACLRARERCLNDAERILDAMPEIGR